MAGYTPYIKRYWNATERCKDWKSGHQEMMASAQSVESTARSALLDIATLNTQKCFFKWNEMKCILKILKKIMAQLVKY